MLRISLRALSGDAPTVMLATCLRICADGTLRGSDNCVVARSVDGCWQMGGKLHRDLDCDGPVNVRLTLRGETSRRLGPFTKVRTGAGVLYGDNNCLNIVVPGRVGDGACVQLTLISAGENNAKA